MNWTIHNSVATWTNPQILAVRPTDAPRSGVFRKAVIFAVIVFVLVLC